MYNHLETLRNYWGFDTFRPLQEEIITSVLSGKDTLGLMPTGGGKSLTFQVPAMTMPGLCVVITPLIALMQDQVANLKKLGIKAIAIHSGCNREEIDIALNNCLYGGYRLLYISPERIASEKFRIRFQEMPVNLIAVDEAHCISQWGYDFRPSYLKIAELRAFHPEVPVLALSATATPVVTEDIQKKLLFRQPNLLKTSFRRENLIYTVKKTENRDRDVIDIIKKLKGSGIVYVRSRRKCVEIAKSLGKEGISVAFYHAGLEHNVRSSVQQNWTVGKTRVIVATNAFGMGIDKTDVRFVIHADLPDSPEAYFQEAGRAGRDGQRSWAILLNAPSDKNSVQQRIQVNFPDLETIKRTYAALGNYLQIPIGGGKGMAFDFNLYEFVRNYRILIFTAYSSLKILETGGYIELTEEISNPSRIKFLLNRDDLYRFQVSNMQFDAFIKLLLRSYTGVFTEFTAIDETMLAKKANVNQDVVKQYLIKLSALGIISYIPQKRSPMVVYTEERLDEKSLFISKDIHQVRKTRYAERVRAILAYAETETRCRSQLLLEYFGEFGSPECGKCDVCRARNEAAEKKRDVAGMQEEILTTLGSGALSIEELAVRLNVNRETLTGIVQWMLDNELISVTEDRLLTGRIQRPD
ncbi:MAG: RecQ family ATP-dependent DNA helicase [Bacteroidales bacterium]|nr:RecQ family ATP-dependent DNA helicase [Bacteroidales bacterium]